MTPFVPMRLSLRGNIKLHKLARKLRQTRAAVSGHLFWLWASVMEQRTDGNITGWDAQEVAYYADWQGDEEAFLAALLDIGWILQSEDELRINDWQDWCGLRDAQCDDDEKKKKWREQKRAQRARAKAQREEMSADSPRTSADSPPERRGEERRDQDHATAASQPRSVLTEVTAKKQAIEAEQQQQQKAPKQDLLPARVNEQGLDFGSTLQWATRHGIHPNLSQKSKMLLVSLCTASPVSVEEMEQAVSKAKSHAAPQPANMGLVVKTLETLRKDAVALAAAGPAAPGAAVTRDMPRVDAKTATVMRGMQRYANGAGDA